MQVENYMTARDRERKGKQKIIKIINPSIFI